MGMNVFALIIIIFGRHLRDGKFIFFIHFPFEFFYISLGKKIWENYKSFFLIHLMAVVFRMNLAKQYFDVK